VPGAEKAFDLAAETFGAALGSVSRYQPGPEPTLGNWERGSREIFTVNADGSGCKD
jgi:hypothetical protein